MNDKDLVHEYNQVRNKIIDNYLFKYVKGTLTNKELEEYNKLNKKATELQREIDFQAMSNEHRNDDKFWNDWSKIHN